MFSFPATGILSSSQSLSLEVGIFSLNLSCCMSLCGVYVVWQSATATEIVVVDGYYFWDFFPDRTGLFHCVYNSYYMH